MPIRPLEDDGKNDIVKYNKELEQRGELTWLNCPWLFSECYLYRRMNTFFTLTKHWKTYDVFNRQKLSTFKSSRPAVLELSEKYKGLIEKLEQAPHVPDPEGVVEAEKLVFFELCEICLWGNATDLSLLTTLTYEELQKLQGSEARIAAEKNILVNQFPAAHQILHEARKNGKKERRIDFVLDNAGFEFFVDLLLVGYLITAGLATHVVLHPKSLPWFVSDVIPKDVDEAFSVLADPQTFFSSVDGLVGEGSSIALAQNEIINIQFMHKHLNSLRNAGKLTVRPDRFWTEGGSFWRMPHDAPELYKYLQAGDLLLLKGDLNYRKLTGDVRAPLSPLTPSLPSQTPFESYTINILCTHLQCHWDPTTPWTTAVGPLANDLRILSLRTCKADVVVDLPQGKDEELRALSKGGGDSGAREWAWSGKWAVVSLSNAPSS